MRRSSVIQRVVTWLVKPPRYEPADDPVIQRAARTPIEDAWFPRNDGGGR